MHCTKVIILGYFGFNLIIYACVRLSLYDTTMSNIDSECARSALRFGIKVARARVGELCWKAEAPGS